MSERITNCPAAAGTIHMPAVFGSGFIDPDNLLYAEVCRNETGFVFAGKRISSSISLADAEPLLLSSGFFRCHRNYLVSFRKITCIAPDHVTVENGDSIPLSLQRKNEFLDAYHKFMKDRAQ